MRGLGGPNCNPVSGSPGSGGCQYFNPFANAFSANAATGQVNPFYVSGIGNSPELINWIRSSLITQYESRLFTVDGQISGKLPITLPGGRVQLAVGVQYRRNGYQVTPIDGNLDQAPCVDSLPYGDGTPTCTNGIGPYGFQASIAPFNVNRSVPGNVLAVRSNFINGPSVKTSGIDASATFDFKNLVSDTDVMVGGDLTYTIDYKRSAVVTPDGIEVEPARDRAGVSELLSAFYSYPRWRANGFINLNRGVANLRWATHYKSGPTNIVTGLPNLKQRREMTHDLTINIDTPFGATLTASVQNLFDTDPPFTRSQYNYDYLTASILGRTFTLGLRQRF